MGLRVESVNRRCTVLPEGPDMATTMIFRCFSDGLMLLLCLASGTMIEEESNHLIFLCRKFFAKQSFSKIEIPQKQSSKSPSKERVVQRRVRLRRVH